MKRISEAPKLIVRLLIMAVALLLSAGPALALDVFAGGPRGMGMAGASIASVNDTNAQYFNPAAFGFMGCKTLNGEKIACDNNNLGRKDWGIDLGASAGIQMHQNFGDYIDTLANIDYQNLSDNGIQSPSDLADLVDLLNGLNGLKDPGNAISANVNLGLGVRFGHFAIGAKGAVELAGRVLDVDTTNLGISGTVDVVELNSQITTQAPAPTGYQPALITDPLLLQSLLDAGLTAEAINSIDQAAVDQGVTSTQIAEFTDTFVVLVEQSGGISTGKLSDNTTTVALNGFGLAEVPLSYGYALNDHWSVGGNLKIMKGRVYGTEVLVFNDGSGDILSSARDHYQDSTTYGLDVGVMGRYNMVNLGLVGRNLNSPEFDGFSQPVDIKDANNNIIVNRTINIDKVKLKPQIAVGIAFIPLETLTLEVDYDLTKNDTALKGYEVQNLSAGLEWDAFRFMALRAGAYKNMAKEDIGLVYTAGLGFNFWLTRLDIGASYASETAQYDGQDYPKEARVSAQLSVDF